MRPTPITLAICAFETPLSNKSLTRFEFFDSFHFLLVAANGRPSFLPLAFMFAKDDFVR